MKKDNYWSIRKFLDDTLKENGGWSIKRILIAVFSPLAVLLAIYIVISDRVLIDKVVNPYAIMVLSNLLTFISVGLGMTVWDKMANKNQETYSESKTSETIITSPSKENEPIG